jgi:hypothetical protein
MAVLNTGLATPSRGFTIPYSCRFNDDDDPILTRSVTGTLSKAHTFSLWIKRGNLTSARHVLAMMGDGSGDISLVEFTNNFIRYMADGAGSYMPQTLAKFRDTSAWYHIVVKVDTAQSSASDRLKIYVNGVEQAYSGTPPPQHHQATMDGCSIGNTGDEIDGCMAEFHFIDGTALTPTSFGETGDYGEWKPKKVAGVTYGTNGFYLDFADAAALGDDESGEGNDFTVTNLDASDQMLDTPTNNFATMNPNDIHDNFNLSEGNLKIYNGDSGTWASARGTFSPTSGKWYFELVIPAIWNYGHVGLLQNTYRISQTDAYENAGSWTYQFDGRTHTNNVETNASLPTLNSGDIVQTAYDVDAGKLWWGVNNTWLLSGDPAAGSNEVYSGITGDVSPHILMYSSPTTGVVMNFGADSSFAGEKTAQGNGDYDFYYTPPSGFKALCTANLDTPAVIPSEHFNTILFDDGAGAKTGVGFQPDFVWLKSRGSTYEHKLTDAVRGVTKTIASNSASTEATDSTGLTAFGADGFTVGADTDYCDTTGDGMVAWNWLAGNATLGTGDFTQGNLASTCSRNVDAGFSIVSYTGNGTDNTTIGHGLSKVPEMVHVKALEGGYNWAAYHKDSNASPELYSAFLNLTNAFDTTDDWSDDAFTATTFSISGGASVNQDTKDFIAYCWHSVDGYSKVGSYVGNDDDDGTFVYTGFRPAWVMAKDADADEWWAILDAERSPYNVAEEALFPNDSYAEQSISGHNSIDFLSNGFKVRGTSTRWNTSGDTYIYLAFAETPFKYSNAR